MEPRQEPVRKVKRKEAKRRSEKQVKTSDEKKRRILDEGLEILGVPLEEGEDNRGRRDGRRWRFLRPAGAGNRRLRTQVKQWVAK